MIGPGRNVTNRPGPPKRRATVERCWHQRFAQLGRCPALGRYGNPEYRVGVSYPGLAAIVRFIRASRWCLAHKNPDDRLVEPDGELW
jgi:hypothetical protein